MKLNTQTNAGLKVNQIAVTKTKPPMPKWNREPKKYADFSPSPTPKARQRKIISILQFVAYNLYGVYVIVIIPDYSLLIFISRDGSHWPPSPLTLKTSTRVRIIEMNNLTRNENTRKILQIDEKKKQISHAEIGMRAQNAMKGNITIEKVFFSIDNDQPHHSKCVR